MDLTFVEGVAAVAASLLVFCGSIWLLLTLIMGARLAYFIVASVVLAFLVIMGVVWSINPLGPVGKLPEWDPVAIGDGPADLEFGPAQQYPEGPWRAPNVEDEAEAALASELQTSAGDYLEQAITDGEVTSFETAADATANADTARLLEQGDRQFGAITFEPVQGDGDATAVAVMRYDPGDPLGPARLITGGTFLLLVLHLFGLARSERKTKEAPAPA